jgi:hypothetical protein
MFTFTFTIVPAYADKVVVVLCTADLVYAGEAHAAFCFGYWVCFRRRYKEVLTELTKWAACHIHALRTSCDPSSAQKRHWH